MGLGRKDDKNAVANAVTGDQLSRTHFFFAYALVTSLFFVWGLSYGLLDSLNKSFQDSLKLTKAQSTGLQAVYFGSYLINGPLSGPAMRKYGYKKGIHFGLGLFSLGAIMFWPCAKFKSFGGFLGSTFVCASGLAWLEVAANSYITVIGKPEKAAFRLVFAQSWNGVASIVGPIIASHTFLKTGKSDQLHGLEWVYLAVSIFGCLINILFFICPLPEVKQEVNDAIEDKVKGSFWKQYHLIFGAFTEFMYTGCQVAVATFAINYFTDHPDYTMTTSAAANLYSACQASFTFGRFIMVPVLWYLDSSLMLFVFGVGSVLFSILTANVPGVGGIICLFFLFFFESICYPIIFTLSTSNLGSYQKLGSSLVAAGVSGGAAWPSIQGVVADNTNTANSYYIPVCGFVVVAMYGLGMNIMQSRRVGHFQWRRMETEQIKAIGAPPVTADEESINDSAKVAEKDSDSVKGPYGNNVNTVTY
ncbi:MFS general substrate transporter [Violaceomyces palustris]|uniref:MFS general substrate transporter n=1 Tax=Violaceomyces palustris TaxID=1673888 RepID=A0ACD0P290_9BASI|nr:MFS general substrate transporter [Violaceomyces palustris]